MDKNHKWYQMAKAWVEGAEIETRYKVGNQWTEWESTANPTWYKNSEYRVKPNPHQHLIDAFNKGAEIEYLDAYGAWVSATTPQWTLNTKYRLKPKKVIKRRFVAYIKNGDLVPTWQHQPPKEMVEGNPIAIVDYIFDAYTNELKGVNIINSNVSDAA